MMAQSKALHLLIAAALVFVNLVCPCASAVVSAQSDVQPVQLENQHAGHQDHQQPQHQAHQDHQAAPANADCPHKQCLDCNSAVALNGDHGALASLSPSLIKVGLDDDTPKLGAALPVEPRRPVSAPATGPPYALIAFATDSPVRRHDLQLK